MTISHAALVLVVAAIACKDPATSRTVARPGEATTVPDLSAAAPAVTLGGSAEPTAPAVPHRAVPLIVEPEVLAAIETAGGGLAALLGATHAKDTAALATASPRYAALAKTIEADLAAIAASTPDAGVTVRGNRHRLFDARWLRSPKTHFELVGVAPRLDRARPPHDCGDVRLIYRLAYETSVRGARVASRVPMTLSVSLSARPGDAAHGCRADAAAWRAPDAIATDPTALGRWVVSADGPLGAGALDPARVVLVLSNLQVLRTPAGAQPSLGGHAEYHLRAFEPDEQGALVATTLENTPDVARIRADKRLRDELLAWLRDEANLAQIDEGLHRLPAHLLATHAVSVSPHGLARPANRSFGAIFTPRELASLPLAGRATIATPEALLRRLDEQTCQGCHQVRSVAGFHLVGRDPPETPAGAALAIAYSPFVATEATRRAQLIDALAAGTSASLARPPSSVEESHAQPAGVGDACEVGSVVASVRSPRLDSIARKRMLRCAPGLSCTRVRGGFPGGMCQASCDALPDGAVCGVIAVHPFNDCLGGGAPYSECMKHVRPIGLARCSDLEPCRDDYVCARTPSGDGACVPPYFLFQMRVDGHPP